MSLLARDARAPAAGLRAVVWREVGLSLARRAVAEGWMDGAFTRETPSCAVGYILTGFLQRAKDDVYTLSRYIASLLIARIALYRFAFDPFR